MLDRNVVTQRVTASATVSDPRVEQVLANATSGAITVTLKSRSGGLVYRVAVQKTDSSGNAVSVVAGSVNVTLAAQNDAAVFELDDLGAFHVFSLSGTTVGSLTIPANSSLLYSSDEFTEEDSFQPVSVDLNLAAGAGVDDPDTAYLAPVMGNVLGDALTKDANTIAAVIGKYSITGARASTYPLAAIVGEIADAVTEADGAIVAVLGGDSALTTARAAFTVDNQNSTPGSSFEYGLDLRGVDHNGYGLVEYTGGDIRFADGTTQSTAASGGASYLVYTALLTQSGTDAPAATILENTLSGPIVWTRNDVGTYTGTLSGAFTVSKTTSPQHRVRQQSDGDSNFVLRVFRDTSNTILLTTKLDDGTPEDGDLTATLIEIRVYP